MQECCVSQVCLTHRMPWPSHRFRLDVHGISEEYWSHNSASQSITSPVGSFIGVHQEISHTDEIRLGPTIYPHLLTTAQCLNTGTITHPTRAPNGRWQLQNWSGPSWRSPFVSANSPIWWSHCKHTCSYIIHFTSPSPLLIIVNWTSHNQSLEIQNPHPSLYSL